MKKELTWKQLGIATLIFFALALLIEGAIGGLFVFTSLMFGLFTLSTYLRSRKKLDK